MKVYADNAATTKMSPIAIETMVKYMENVYGNPSSLHSVGQEAAEALSQARETIAKYLGCSSKEIYFTSGGSEADNQDIISAAKSILSQQPLNITQFCILLTDCQRKALKLSFYPLMKTE